MRFFIKSEVGDQLPYFKWKQVRNCLIKLNKKKLVKCIWIAELSEWKFMNR